MVLLHREKKLYRLAAAVPLDAELKYLDTQQNSTTNEQVTHANIE
jgi:hypothetical protein